MMYNSVIIGVDPGLSGALAVMVNGSLVEIEDMPTMSRQVGGKERRYVAVDALDSIVRSIIRSWVGPADEVLCVIEEVGARPKEGAVGAFAFGKGVGALEGVIVGQSIPRQYVQPALWKRQLKLRKGKDVSRQRAMERFPDHRDEFIRVKDDGRAEAALIAHWAFQERHK